MHYDLFVIGAGSGGVRVSRMAAATGAKVAVAESSDMGGTCVNLGCVPKKLFVYSSEFSEAFSDAKGFGWSVGESTFDWETLRDNKNKEISRLNSIYDKMLGNAKVEVIKGHAKIINNNTVSINGEEHSADKILIATGSRPFTPDFPGNEHVISSNEFFHLEKFPKRCLVVGGGYIAVEFAGILNGLGVETTLAYRKEVFLRGFDDDLRHFVKDEVAKKGINLLFNTEVKEIIKDGDDLNVLYNTQLRAQYDLVIYCTGRVANLEGLGLENVNIELNQNGTIKADDNFETSVKGIYALGDVIGTPQLTPVALAQGMAFVSTHFKDKKIKMDYTNIPTAVFCQPNIGTVGLGEEEAKKLGHEIDVYTSDFKAMKNTISGSEERTFMKLVVDQKTDKVLGVHMVGQDAGEIIQGMGVALKAGATKEVFDSTIGIHPTSAEEFVTMRSKTR